MLIKRQMIIHCNTQKSDIVDKWCLLPVIKTSDLDGFNKMPFSRCHLVKASVPVSVL